MIKSYFYQLELKEQRTFYFQLKKNISQLFDVDRTRVRAKAIIINILEIFFKLALNTQMNLISQISSYYQTSIDSQGFLVENFALRLLHSEAIYNSKQKVMALVFHNQPIINKGQTINCLYKLLKGTAVIVDSKGNSVLTIRPPAYLNLPETIYDYPATKTIRAEGRCEVGRVKVKEVHKKVIRTMKEKGMRRSNFPLFEDVPSACFYSLMQYASIKTIEKGRFVPAQKHSLYLILEGHLSISMDAKTKLLRLQQSETLTVGQTDIWLVVQAEGVRVAVVASTTTELLLADHYFLIKQHGEYQRGLLDSYEVRNKRISVGLKHSRQRSIEERPPKDFVNKIQARVERFDQYKRTRSCFASCRWDPEQIVAQNEKKYIQLMNLNRKKLGQEYIYRKRLQVRGQVQSYSHSPRSHSLQQPTAKDHSLYDTFSPKTQYGLLKRHPEFSRSRKQGLIRRTNALKRGFGSHCVSRAGSGDKAAK